MTAGSTKKIYLNGLGASLVNLAAISVYSLLVIRLSLSYLDKEEYGLLSLVTQVAAYIAILDLGLSTAFSRILIDYTTGTKARYANGLKTASRIFHILGLVGCLTAIVVAFFGSSYLSIPHSLQREFTILMTAQGLSLFCAFALKPITTPLVANGKYHYICWLSTCFSFVNILVFWLALRGGIGIYSSLLGNTVVLALNACALRLLARPYITSKNIRGHFDLTIFKEVAAFSRDSILWQVGGQTLASLPVILAAAMFTLGATADLSSGMKLILLMISVCTRFGDMSVTPLSIRFANGDESGAAMQITRICGVVGGISACAAIFIVCVNPAFINWWMLDKILWSWHENMAGALWVAILPVTQCMYGYAVVCRQMGIIRWALLSECVIYVTLSFGFEPWAGTACLLWAKPLATLLITLAVAWQIRKKTLFDTAVLLPLFMRQIATLALLLPICIYATDRISGFFENPLQAVMVSALFSAIIILIALPLLSTRAIRRDISLLLSDVLSRRKDA